MALVLKKVVDLSQVSDIYSGVVIEFKAIPVAQLGKLNEDQEKLEAGSNEQFKFFVDMLKEQFLSGKQGEDDLTKDDIDVLDADGLIFCFQMITGADIDPKAKSESTSSSSTESETAPK